MHDYIYLTSFSCFFIQLNWFTSNNITHFRLEFVSPHSKVPYSVPCTAQRTMHFIWSTQSGSDWDETGSKIIHGSNRGSQTVILKVTEPDLYHMVQIMLYLMFSSCFVSGKTQIENAIKIIWRWRISNVLCGECFIKGKKTAPGKAAPFQNSMEFPLPWKVPPPCLSVCLSLYDQNVSALWNL